MLKRTSFYFSILALIVSPTFASEPAASINSLGEQKLGRHVFLLPDAMPLPADQPLADQVVTPVGVGSPRFVERLLELMVRTLERARLTGSFPISAGMGSGRGGSTCFSKLGPVLFCIGGDAISTARLNALQGKLGAGVYLKKDFGKHAPTVVVGPELRLSLGLEGLVPKHISFVEGGIGISAF